MLIYCGGIFLFLHLQAKQTNQKLDIVVHAFVRQTVREIHEQKGNQKDLHSRCQNPRKRETNSERERKRERERETGRWA